MVPISRQAFTDAYAGLCSCKGARHSLEMEGFWYEKLQKYSREAIHDAFDAMISGSRSFPTLDEVRGWLRSSSKHQPFGEKPQYEETDLTDQDKSFGQRMAPLYRAWSERKITNHTYFQEMKMHCEDCGVKCNWQAFVDMGFSLPWVAESRYEGDDSVKCGGGLPR